MSFELPSELWLKIFRELSYKSLLDIHAASRLFSDLSVSILFKYVHLCPTTYRGSQKRIDQDLRREADRIAFWSSDKIALHVRRCTVNVTEIEPRVSIVSEPASTSPRVSACFEAVSRFQNLQNLACILRSLTDLEIPALCVEALPCLEWLRISLG
ncbi:hypothetical protein C8R45DRAFT_1108119 [Mycena sanguinolenta]|nr:hypothetical protein C8R45DRAFT_1108119 [Mycena sanguinolenta]